MQYLWSQEEMDANRQLLADVKRLPSPKKLQEFCTWVADNAPVPSGYLAGQPWGCILTTRTGMAYCDNCPAREVCPHPSKHWSK